MQEENKKTILHNNKLKKVIMNVTFTENEISSLIDQAMTKSETLIKNNLWIEGESILKQILRIDPDHENALRLLSQLYISQKKSLDAIPLYEKILEKIPNDYESLNNLALCYAANKNKEKSLELFKKCIFFYPEIPSTYCNLALQYKNEGNHEESYKIYQQGIERLPQDPNIRYNYAIELAEQKQFDEAIKQYKKSIELNPNFPQAHFNLSLLNLFIGNYEEGWKGYDWRFDYIDVFRRFKERFTGQEWKGEDGTNKTILVYNEQGVGDTIQFARYLPKLKEKGFKVILEVPFELMDIMYQSEGIDEVFLLRSKNIPNYDYHVSIGSLPALLQIYKPFWDGPYIKPTGSSQKYFNNYKQFKKVGICWAGNPIHRNDKNRSCFLKEFKVINDIYNVKLFSLQKDVRPRFWGDMGVVDLTEDCRDMGVVNMGDMLIDFNYTAAIMKCMDYIVTVDSAIAHLAGAMNLPCFLLLPYMADFRWGVEGDKTDWYPSIKLVRQTEPGNYTDPMRKIAHEIKQL